MKTALETRMMLRDAENILRSPLPFTVPPNVWFYSQGVVDREANTERDINNESYIAGWVAMDEALVIR